MQSAWWSVGMALALAAVLPKLGRRQWWILAFEFPRFQLALLGLALVPVVVVTAPSWDVAGLAAGGLLVAGAAYQLAHVLPYTPLVRPTVVARADAQPARRLRLLVANVRQDNRDAAALLALAGRADADLVLLVETDRRWLRDLAPLLARYPHRVMQPQDNTYGMVLVSRLALLGPEVRFLVTDDVPSIRTGLRLPSGDRVLLYALHPRPPVPQEAEDGTERDAELLLAAREIRRRGRPTVVIGDFNDVAWSATSRRMQRLGGLLDPRVGRGRFSTFPAAWPGLRWPLDHVFHSEHFALVEMRTLPPFGSDHLAVLVALALQETVPEEQSEPQPEPGDREVLEEVLEDALGERRQLARGKLGCEAEGGRNGPGDGPGLPPDRGRRTDNVRQ